MRSPRCSGRLVRSWQWSVRPAPERPGCLRLRWTHGDTPGSQVFGVGPSASSAQQLADGAGTAADTLHKLVYEHHTKWAERRQPPDSQWAFPAGSVVIIDEAGMVDTRLLHTYAQIAQRNHWRTILVGDHRQLDAVDAGGMFAELVEYPDVVTAGLDTLHRFDHQWEADASHLIRNGDQAAVEEYERHGRIHGHADEEAAVAAAVGAAFAGTVEGRDVLVMASTNRVVEHVNAITTDRLLAAGLLDPNDGIEIGGQRFYVGQPVVTRANDRRLTHGPDDEQWVRNGDRWTVIAGPRDKLHLEHRDTRDRQSLPAEYIEAGNVTVDYASTIHRAQGATVDEAHLIVSEHTDAKQLYVGVTRGRTANHIHVRPPSFDNEHHGPNTAPAEWSPMDSLAAALQRQGATTAALARRRHLRNEVADSRSAQAEVASTPAEQRQAALRNRRRTAGMSR